jgi:hypothetical protein
VSHHTQTARARTATERLIDALTDPDRLFTPAEVAYLMSSAGRWGHDARAAESAPDPLSAAAGWDAGYRTRVAEENEAYPPVPIFVVGRWFDRADYRRSCDAVARVPRDGDYLGGPVPVWDADRPPIVPPPVSVRVVRAGNSWTWRDAA